MFKTTSHDFGTVARGAKTEFRFELQNKYVEDVHIVRVQASCGCTTPKILKADLATWEKGAILAVFNTHSFLGHRSATIRVVIDKPFPAEVQLSVRGHIRGDVVFEPGVVQFGEIDQGTAAERKVRLNYAGRPGWKVTDVQSDNADLEVELQPNPQNSGRVSYQMLVRLKETASAGYLQEQIMLVTNDRGSDGRPQTIPLMVEGRVASPVTVSPSSLILGTVRMGEPVTKRMVVRAKEPFRVTSVTCEGDCFDFKTSSDAKKIHLIPVTFNPATEGKVVEKIEIKTDLGVQVCVATANVTKAN